MALAGQALLAVCSPPASPVGSLSALHLLSAQRGRGLLRRPPHMTCGELFGVEGAPWAMAPSKLAPLPSLPLCFTCHPLARCTTQNEADSAMLGRAFSLSLKAGEDLKSSQAHHPMPHESSRQTVPTSNASQRHQGDTAHTGHIIQSPDFIIPVITEWLWCTVPAV